MAKKNHVIVDIKAVNNILNQKFFNYVDLSKKSGINYNTLIRIKRTGRSSVRTVRSLARALQVSPASIAEIKSE
ncbi:helix-turn-helix transcriptional regulator [uncultured Dialister sp.]|uniref:helix-turn-helix domain-containing protein n=1 Tax=uncultured Dialister sp. TaxID=278064 RepID=UPI0026DBF11C|nr:helix-turn-helix domain-containing protein [uncultured Dialister sp.]